MKGKTTRDTGEGAERSSEKASRQEPTLEGWRKRR